MTARLSLALLLLILSHPASHVYAAEIPNSAETPPTSTTEPIATPATGYYYIVQSTDTLWDIAVAHTITVDELIAANNLPDPRHLVTGQKVFVPAEPAVVPRKPTPIPSVPTNTPVAETPPANASGSEPAPADAPTAVLPEPTREATATAPPPEPMPEPPPAPAPEVGAAQEPTGAQAEMLGLINASRGAQGLPILAWSPALAAAAQAHAEDCAQRNQGSHVGSDGAKLAARLARIDYSARYTSENWANAQSVQHAFSMWWNEPKGRDPHRRNILNPRFTEIGIGVARGPWGYYFVADFGGR